MSENPAIQEEMIEQAPMTEEEIAALEAERQAAYEAKLAPYNALKQQMAANANELTDLQTALVDVYEQILTQ